MNIRLFIQRLTSPPVFPDDAEKTRVAEILSKVLWLSILSWICILPVLPSVPLPFLAAAILAGLTLLGYASLYWMKKGHVRPVALGFTVLLWVSAVSSVIAMGHLENTETMGILVALVAAGLLNGAWALMLFSTLSIVVIIAIYIAEAQGWLMVLLPFTPFLQMILAIANIFLITALVGLALRSLKDAESHTRQRAQELDEKSQSLQMLLIAAEQQMIERTRNAEVARQEAEIARQEVETQAWYVIGQARLNQVMRGDQEAGELANNITNQICHYLDVMPGALYIRKKDQFEWAGGFAYLPSDISQATFALGEGGAGQAALEQKHILLDHLPVGYMPLVSGLGDAQPRQIVICPLGYNQKIIGVLELGTLDAFSPQQLEFLDQVSENIAIALNTAQTRAQVDDLLEETQRMAEELRAVNEELEAQTEILRSARK